MQRYEPTLLEISAIKEDPAGEYVRFEDVQALAREVLLSLKRPTIVDAEHVIRQKALFDELRAIVGSAESGSGGEN